MWLEYPVHICLQRLPDPSVWMFVIKHHSYYRRCKTKYRWRSVDAHFHDRARRILLSVCLWRQPNIPLWLNTTYRSCDFPGRMNKNRWRSFKAHFHDGAGRVVLSILPIKGAKNSFVTDCNLSEVWFPRTYDQKFWRLCWRSFCHGCIHNTQSFNLVQFIIHIVLAAFLAFSYTFFLITTLFFNNT
jgi:hypothetical protein